MWTFHPGLTLLPAFLLLVAIERAVLVRRGLGHSGSDARGLVSNLACGVGQLTLRPLYEALFAYACIYLHHFRIATLPDSLAVAVVLFVALDFVYYLYHRASHASPLMWAWHGVHHQSELHDLSVSFRLSWLGSAIERAFYLPFAVLGFPPVLIVVVAGLNSFCQFFVHTRAVRSLGPLELFLNTPSHHRVHHGIEAHYVDRNFGGVFIVWDRLFGTFTPEGDEPTYGLAHPLKSLSPLVANVAPWLALVGVEIDRAPRARVDGRVLAWVAMQLALCVGATCICVADCGVRTAPTLVSIGLAVIATATLGAVLDARPHAWRLELARAGATIAAAYLFLGARAAALVTIVALLSMLWLAAIRAVPVSVRASYHAGPC